MEYTVKRNNNFLLDAIDYQVLLMLYKPLVGPGPIDLYLSLYELSYGERQVTKSIYYIKDIISDFRLQMDDFEKYLYFLECVGLIRRSGPLIELFPNYNKEEYFALPFVPCLAFNTSKSQFEYLRRRFYGKQIDYIKIDDYEIKKLKESISPNKRSNDSVPFSFDEFMSNADDLKDEIKGDREFYTSVSKVFSYTLETMLRILNETEDDGKVDKNVFLEKAYSRFSDSLEKERLRNKKTISDNENINFFCLHHAEELLQNTKSGKGLSPSDKSTLRRLRGELNVPEELITLLIAYSLATNESKMHAFKYYETIITDWKDKNILSAEDAYLYINTLYSKERTTKFSKKTNTNKPEETEQSAKDWFDGFWSQYKE